MRLGGILSGDHVHRCWLDVVICLCSVLSNAWMMCCSLRFGTKTARHAVGVYGRIIKVLDYVKVQSAVYCT